MSTTAILCQKTVITFVFVKAYLAIKTEVDGCRTAYYLL